MISQFALLNLESESGFTFRTSWDSWILSLPWDCHCHSSYTHIAFARHVWPASTFGVKWRSWMVTWMIEWWNINTIPCWSISDDFFWGNWGEQKTATYKPIFTSERAAGWQRDVFLNGADQRSARIFRKVTRTYLYQESFLRGKSFSNCQYFRRYVFWECKCLGNFVGNSSKFI